MFMRYFFNWFVVALVCTFLCALVYLTVQQSQRSAANDPQIQLAEDAAAALANGRSLSEFDAGAKIDIARSLAPFIIIYDAQGQPVASNGALDGRMPTLPAGVLEAARRSGQNRVTWQPRAGLRYALVIARACGKFEGFAAAGRSLREIERRESYTLKAAAACWLLFLTSTFLLSFFSAGGRRKARGCLNDWENSKSSKS
jgi:hypothetical protein